MPDYIASLTLGQLAIIAAIIGSVLTALRRIGPALHTWDALMHDLLGDQARPGVPARPGVLERLALLESSQATIARQLTELRTEVHQLLTKGPHDEDRPSQ